MNMCEAGWLAFAAISLLAVCITAYDKHQAVWHRYRVPESALLWIGALGGACAMFFTMLIIRHKTRHIKFMAGLPAFMILQAAAGFYLAWKWHF